MKSMIQGPNWIEDFLGWGTRINDQDREKVVFREDDV